MYKKISILLLIVCATFLFGCSIKPQEYGEITYKVATEDFTNSDLSDTGNTLTERVESIGYDSKVSINNNQIKLQVFDVVDEAQLKALGKTISKPSKLKFLDSDGNIILTNKNLEQAKVLYDKVDKTSVVHIKLDEDGTKVFSKATNRLSKESDMDKKILLIMIDDEVISAPMVNRPIEDGNAIISGDFDEGTSSHLCNLLNSGSLEVPLEMTESKVITQN